MYLSAFFVKVQIPFQLPWITQFPSRPLWRLLVNYDHGVDLRMVRPMGLPDAFFAIPGPLAPGAIRTDGPLVRNSKLFRGWFHFTPYQNWRIFDPEYTACFVGQSNVLGTAFA